MEKNRQTQTAVPQVAIALPGNKKILLTLACVLLMLYIASSGSAIAVMQSVLLKRLNAMQNFAITTVAGVIGLSIMTPIGGKLLDIVGRKRMMIVSPVLAIVCLIALAYSTNFTMFITFRFLLGVMQGAFTAAPYIMVSLINERKDVPKNMGYLASSVALGSFGGPFIAGMLSDMGRLDLAIAFPAVFLVIAIALIVYALPDTRPLTKVKLDIPGIVLLTVLVTAFVLTMNFGSALGWTNPIILGGFTMTIVSFVLFVKAESASENRGDQPIIAMSLFKNKEYTLLLLVGLACYYYMTPMLSYGSLAGFQILGASGKVVGLFSLPRTVISMLLPTLTGIWVGRNKRNSWKAMALASGIVALTMIPFTMVSASTPLMTFFVAFGITGIAESFRAVAITPAAQATLKPEQLASGTSLVNFFNSMASVVAGTISGTLFNAAQPQVVQGVRSVFVATVVVSIIGFLLVVGFIRKWQLARIEQTETAVAATVAGAAVK